MLVHSDDGSTPKIRITCLQKMRDQCCRLGMESDAESVLVGDYRESR